MTSLLYVAAVLLIAIGVAHSYLGERYILIRLFRRQDLPKLFGGIEFTIRTLRFAWHITTIAWWGFAAIVFLLAKGPVSPRSIAMVIGITFNISGLITLGASRGKHFAWIIFLLIGGMATLYAVAA